MTAIPKAERPCLVELHVEHHEGDSFCVYAGGVLIAAYDTRYQAGSHCLRLHAQQEAEQSAFGTST